MKRKQPLVNAIIVKQDTVFHESILNIYEKTNREGQIHPPIFLIPERDFGVRIGEGAMCSCGERRDLYEIPGMPWHIDYCEKCDEGKVLFDHTPHATEMPGMSSGE